MTMIVRANIVTKLETGLTDSEISKALVGFTDADGVSSYAKAGISACVKAGVVTGRSNSMIAPQDYITRAEVGDRGRFC